jgi:dCTP diphosphatase
MTDKNTTIQQLKDLGRKFREERGWKHADMRDVAMSVCLEAAELLEHFQWIEVNEVQSNPRWVKAVGEEISDVAVQLFELVDRLEIDFVSVYEAKAIKTAEKYPIKDFNPNIGVADQMKAFYRVKAKTRTDYPFKEESEAKS